MDGRVHQNLAVPRPVPALGELPLVAAVGAGVRGEVLLGAKVHPPAGQVGGDARLQHLLGDGGRAQIHIGHTGDAAGDHLRQPQGRPGAHRPVVQPGLGGEDVPLEPVLKVVPPTVPPHEGHGQVGVGVDQAGHHHLAGAVQDLIVHPLGALGPHVGDPGSLHGDIAVFQGGERLVQEQSGDVGEQG